MVKRPFWISSIEKAWESRSLIWLAGVRRAGKTRLSQTLPNIEYLDCELPRTRQRLEDIESFFESIHKNKRLILDEVHRLNNPSEVLKIATDHYPHIKILATGSSSLGASAKFGDTLTGRKTEIYLTPLLDSEKVLFGHSDIKHRLLMGGLPSFFMSKELPEQDYQEWIDAYWAKDIQELFRLEKRFSFQKFFELILAQSGSIFEATKFAIPCEASRQTISNYLSVLQATFVAHVIKPFNTHRNTEIISAPKVYGFDTGFVCYAKGWSTLRREDLGFLWEHYVLNEIQAHFHMKNIYYWRDKQQHEIDFILLKQRNHSPIAIECKWLSKNFDPSNLKIFRQHYQEGKNFVVASDVTTSFQKKYGDISVTYIGIHRLIDAINNSL